jgi:hypothetical protein
LAAALLKPPDANLILREQGVDALRAIIDSTPPEPIASARKDDGEAKPEPEADATPEQIGNALAGLHADYVAWFMDETGDYPDAIMPTVEAIFAGSPKVARIVQAGNPTRLSGPLYPAVSKARHLWRVIDITADPDDPRRTPRVSVDHAREQIGLYGRDNPWVLINIFGEFPPSSLNALIGPEEVKLRARVQTKRGGL